MDNFLLSFVMMLLWSVIFSLLFLATRRTKLFRSRFGITASIVICACMYIRMLVPFDVGLYRRVRITWGWFVGLYDSINLTKLPIVNISVTELLCFIWIAGAVICLTWWADKCRKVRMWVDFHKVITEERYRDVMECIYTERGLTARAVLVECKGLASPMTIGVLHPRILLASEGYTDEQLYYILSHELQHIQNKDMLLQFASNVLCYLFWWNPLLYMLRKEMESCIEIRCDVCVTTDMPVEEKKSYLKTIVDVMKDASEGGLFKKKRGFLLNSAGMASETYEKAYLERFRAVARGESPYGKSKILSVLWTVFVFGLLLFSYLFVLSPYHKASADDFDATYGYSKIDSEDIWFTVTEDGQYILRTAEEDEGTYIVEEEMVRFMSTQADVKLFDSQSIETLDISANITTAEDIQSNLNVFDPSLKDVENIEP